MKIAWWKASLQWTIKLIICNLFIFIIIFVCEDIYGINVSENDRQIIKWLESVKLLRSFIFKWYFVESISEPTSREPISTLPISILFYDFHQTIYEALKVSQTQLERFFSFLIPFKKLFVCYLFWKKNPTAWYSLTSTKLWKSIDWTCKGKVRSYLIFNEYVFIEL